MIDTISLTDLKQNTSKVIKRIKSASRPIMVLQHSKAAAILIDPEYYQTLEEALDDLEDIRAIEDRKKEPTISLDKYLNERFKKRK